MSMRDRNDTVVDMYACSLSTLELLDNLWDVKG